MIVDAQIHVWENDRADRPWPSKGSEGRTSTPQRESPLSPAEALVAMDEAGVDRAILVPPSWEGDRNDLALSAAATHPDRFAVMGRIPSDATTLDGWRAKRGMLGARLIMTHEDESHWLWSAAADAGVPLMVAPAGRIPEIARIAQKHRNLPIIIDHLGARVHCTGASAFAAIDCLIDMAKLPNVAIKATCLPAYSAMAHPWSDVVGYLRRLYDAFGAQRMFWGSDLSRLPCPYPVLLRYFQEELPWLKGVERDAVMGGAIMKWLDWK